MEGYKSLGAKFAKWRAVITIGDDIPSTACMIANSHALARYASICQEVDIVPIVEPEVLMDGPHNIQECFDVTNKMQSILFEELDKLDISLSGIILKPNMITSGSDCKIKSSSEEIAELTVRCLGNNVPIEVPGIAFLSGGQSEIEATENLNAINKIEETPWSLSFSYGRALQASALQAWKGLQDNEGECSKAFLHRAKMNSLATKGVWTKDQEN